LKHQPPKPGLESEGEEGDESEGEEGKESEGKEGKTSEGEGAKEGGNISHRNNHTHNHTHNHNHNHQALVHDKDAIFMESRETCLVTSSTSSMDIQAHPNPLVSRDNNVVSTLHGSDPTNATSITPSTTPMTSSTTPPHSLHPPTNPSGEENVSTAPSSDRFRDLSIMDRTLSLSIMLTLVDPEKLNRNAGGEEGEGRKEERNHNIDPVEREEERKEEKEIDAVGETKDSMYARTLRTEDENKEAVVQIVEEPKEYLVNHSNNGSGNVRCNSELQDKSMGDENVGVEDAEIENRRNSLLNATFPPRSTFPSLSSPLPSPLPSPPTSPSPFLSPHAPPTTMGLGLGSTAVKLPSLKEIMNQPRLCKPSQKLDDEFSKKGQDKRQEDANKSSNINNNNHNHSYNHKKHYNAPATVATTTPNPDDTRSQWSEEENLAGRNDAKLNRRFVGSIMKADYNRSDLPFDASNFPHSPDHLPPKLDPHSIATQRPFPIPSPSPSPFALAPISSPPSSFLPIYNASHSPSSSSFPPCSSFLLTATGASSFACYSTFSPPHSPPAYIPPSAPALALPGQSSFGMTALLYKQKEKEKEKEKQLSLGFNRLINANFHRQLQEGGGGEGRVPIDLMREESKDVMNTAVAAIAAVLGSKDDEE